MLRRCSQYGENFLLDVSPLTDFLPVKLLVKVKDIRIKSASRIIVSLCLLDYMKTVYCFYNSID